MVRKGIHINIFRFFLIVLYTLSFSLILYSLISGWEFYTTPIMVRPHHSDYSLLKPGGFCGHGFGIVGSAMMVLLLVYSLRKRIGFMQKWGAVQQWLNFHIFLGITGPLLVILHSAFKVQGLIAVSFWSMIAVALSGVLGRFLYVQIPRNIHGNELSLKELEDMHDDMASRLKKQFLLESKEIDRIDEIIGGKVAAAASLWGALRYVFGGNILRVLRIRKLKKVLRVYMDIPEDKIKEVVKLAKDKAVLRRRIAFWQAIHNLFHYWHVFHKPFAVVMYIIMLVHAGVSVWLGYTWIF